MLSEVRTEDTEDDLPSFKPIADCTIEELEFGAWHADTEAADARETAKRARAEIRRRRRREAFISVFSAGAMWAEREAHDDKLPSDQKELLTAAQMAAEGFLDDD